MIKKYFILGIISILFLRTFSQTKMDTTVQIIIPYICIENSEIIHLYKFFIDFDTLDLHLPHLIRKNLIPIGDFCIRISKNDFETLTIINPKVSIILEYDSPTFLDSPYRQKHKFEGRFNDLIDKEFNILELKIAKTKKIKYRYISSKNEIRVRWNKNYSKTTF